MSAGQDHEANLQDRESQVLNLSNTGKNAEAVKYAVSNPPYGATDDIKARSTEVFLQAISTIKSADIKGIVDGLNDDECDGVMKYVYAGLAKDEKTDDPLEQRSRATQCGSLLAWHGALKEKAGLGCIIRAMTAPQL
eukprot:CAMPEP_0201550500 /NCGR_PEP_ID=MMETSP0173_2-20130828/6851_1 /ASSEMBLY_ACC=CAM_ASM_000268 /TAXON_ID=218659 /ORGANISM="Vexillifera sp., Strain DIVA3 564/2" /LENGTH=136 /DNA_ID=CAMNT_0047960487 /DNA_START=44 /DNA_END=454 /DNA_ORIENTATION=+